MRRQEQGPVSHVLGKHGNKVVVITGASAGVGRAAAREFARSGADIALLARNADALNNACAEVAAGMELLHAAALDGLLVRLIAAVGLMWFLILLGLSLTDYLMRHPIAS